MLDKLDMRKSVAEKTSLQHCPHIVSSFKYLALQKVVQSSLGNLRRRRLHLRLLLPLQLLGDLLLLQLLLLLGDLLLLQLLRKQRVRLAEGSCLQLQLLLQLLLLQLLLLRMAEGSCLLQDQPLPLLDLLLPLLLLRQELVPLEPLLKQLLLQPPRLKHRPMLIMTARRSMR